MLRLLIDVLAAVAACLVAVGCGALALVAWAFAFSLPLALFWAAFRAWARLFGA